MLGKFFRAKVTMSHSTSAALEAGFCGLNQFSLDSILIMKNQHC